MPDNDISKLSFSVDVTDAKNAIETFVNKDLKKVSDAFDVNGPLAQELKKNVKNLSEMLLGNKDLAKQLNAGALKTALGTIQEAVQGVNGEFSTMERNVYAVAKRISKRVETISNDALNKAQAVSKALNDALGNLGGGGAVKTDGMFKTMEAVSKDARDQLNSIASAADNVAQYLRMFSEGDRTAENFSSMLAKINKTAEQFSGLDKFPLLDQLKEDSGYRKAAEGYIAEIDKIKQALVALQAQTQQSNIGASLAAFPETLEAFNKASEGFENAIGTNKFKSFHRDLEDLASQANIDGLEHLKKQVDNVIDAITDYKANLGMGESAEALKKSVQSIKDAWSELLQGTGSATTPATGKDPLTQASGLAATFNTALAPISNAVKEMNDKADEAKRAARKTKESIAEVAEAPVPRESGLLEIATIFEKLGTGYRYLPENPSEKITPFIEGIRNIGNTLREHGAYISDLNNFVASLNDIRRGFEEVVAANTSESFVNLLGTVNGISEAKAKNLLDISSALERFALLKAPKEGFAQTFKIYLEAFQKYGKAIGAIKEEDVSRFGFAKQNGEFEKFVHEFQNEINKFDVGSKLKIDVEGIKQAIETIPSKITEVSDQVKGMTIEAPTFSFGGNGGVNIDQKSVDSLRESISKALSPVPVTIEPKIETKEVNGQQISSFDSLLNTLDEKMREFYTLHGLLLDNSQALFQISSTKEQIEKLGEWLDKNPLTLTLNIPNKGSASQTISSVAQSITAAATNAQQGINNAIQQMTASISSTATAATQSMQNAANAARKNISGAGAATTPPVKLKFIATKTAIDNALKSIKPYLQSLALPRIKLLFAAFKTDVDNALSTVKPYLQQMSMPSIQLTFSGLTQTQINNLETFATKLHDVVTDMQNAAKAAKELAKDVQTLAKFGIRSINQSDVQFGGKRSAITAKGLKDAQDFMQNSNEFAQLAKNASAEREKILEDTRKGFDADALTQTRSGGQLVDSLNEAKRLVQGAAQAGKNWAQSMEAGADAFKQQNGLAQKITDKAKEAKDLYDGNSKKATKAFDDRNALIASALSTAKSGKPSIGAAGVSANMLGLNTTYLKELQLQAKLTGNAFADMLGTMGFALTGKSVIQFFQQAIRLSTQFGMELRRIQSLATDFSFSKLDTGLRSIDARLGNITHNAQALYWAFSSGVRGSEEQLVAFTEKMSKLAMVIKADVMPTMDAATAIMNAYGLSAEDAGKVSDTLFSIVKYGKASGSQLAMSIGHVIGPAAALGIELDDLGATAATLTRTMKTQNALTYLNNIIMKMQNPTNEVKETLEKLGLEINSTAIKAKGFARVIQEIREATKGDIGLITKLFPDIRGQRAAITLLSTQFDDFERQVENFKKNEGATDEAADKLLNNPQAAFNALANTVEMIKTEAGRAAVNFLTMGGAIGGFVDKVNSMKAGGRTFMGYTVAIGAMLLGMGAMDKMVSMLNYNLANLQIQKAGAEMEQMSLGAVSAISQQQQLQLATMKTYAEEVKRLNEDIANDAELSKIKSEQEALRLREENLKILQQELQITDNEAKKIADAALLQRKVDVAAARFKATYAAKGYADEANKTKMDTETAASVVNEQRRIIADYNAMTNAMAKEMGIVTKLGGDFQNTLRAFIKTQSQTIQQFMQNGADIDADKLTALSSATGLDLADPRMVALLRRSIIAATQTELLDSLEEYSQGKNIGGGNMSEAGLQAGRLMTEVMKRNKDLMQSELQLLEASIDQEAEKGQRKAQREFLERQLEFQKDRVDIGMRELEAKERLGVENRTLNNKRLQDDANFLAANIKQWQESLDNLNKMYAARIQDAYSKDPTGGRAKQIKEEYQKEIDALYAEIGKVNAPADPFARPFEDARKRAVSLTQDLKYIENRLKTLYSLQDNYNQQLNVPNTFLSKQLLLTNKLQRATRLVAKAEAQKLAYQKEALAIAAQLQQQNFNNNPTAWGGLVAAARVSGKNAENLLGLGRIASKASYIPGMGGMMVGTILRPLSMFSGEMGKVLSVFTTGMTKAFQGVIKIAGRDFGKQLAAGVAANRMGVGGAFTMKSANLMAGTLLNTDIFNKRELAAARAALGMTTKQLASSMWMMAGAGVAVIAVLAGLTAILVATSEDGGPLAKWAESLAGVNKELEKQSHLNNQIALYEETAARKKEYRDRLVMLRNELDAEIKVNTVRGRSVELLNSLKDRTSAINDALRHVGGGTPEDLTEASKKVGKMTTKLDEKRKELTDLYAAGADRWAITSLETEIEDLEKEYNRLQSEYEAVKSGHEHGISEQLVRLLAIEELRSKMAGIDEDIAEKEMEGKSNVEKSLMLKKRVLRYQKDLADMGATQAEREKEASRLQYNEDAARAKLKAKQDEMEKCLAKRPKDVDSAEYKAMDEERKGLERRLKEAEKANSDFSTKVVERYRLLKNSEKAIQDWQKELARLMRDGAQAQLKFNSLFYNGTGLFKPIVDGLGTFNADLNALKEASDASLKEYQDAKKEFDKQRTDAEKDLEAAKGQNLIDRIKEAQAAMDAAETPTKDLLDKFNKATQDMQALQQKLAEYAKSATNAFNGFQNLMEAINGREFERVMSGRQQAPGGIGTRKFAQNYIKNQNDRINELRNSLFITGYKLQNGDNDIATRNALISEYASNMQELNKMYDARNAAIDKLRESEIEARRGILDMAAALNKLKTTAVDAVDATSSQAMSLRFRTWERVRLPDMGPAPSARHYEESDSVLRNFASLGAKMGAATVDAINKYIDANVKGPAQQMFSGNNRGWQQVTDSFERAVAGFNSTVGGLQKDGLKISISSVDPFGGGNNGN